MFRGTFGGSNKHACGVKVSPNIGIKTTLNDSEKEKKSLFVCLLFAAFVVAVILVNRWNTTAIIGPHYEGVDQYLVSCFKT